MRLERHTLLLGKQGENVFEKGDMVFEAKAPAVFKIEHVMAVTPDLRYPAWYSLLGILHWVIIPLPVIVTTTANWKHYKRLVLKWLQPFRMLSDWLSLRHKRRALGHLLVRSIRIGDLEGLPVAVPFLGATGDTFLYVNLPPIKPDVPLRVVLKDIRGARDETPAITLCAVGFTIHGVPYETVRTGPDAGR